MKATNSGSLASLRMTFSVILRSEATKDLLSRALTIIRLVPPLLLVGACFRGKLPPIEYYRLRLPADTDTVASMDHDGASSALAAGAIAIVPYVTPGIYGDGGVVYRVDESAYGAYPNREWAMPLSTMLGMLTQDLFRVHPVTRDQPVFDPPSPHAYAYIWRGLVRELEEVDRGQQVFAAVRLEARLVRARDDSLLWSGSVRLERPVPQGTMPAIVDALSSLASEAIAQLRDSARAALIAPAASAATAPR